MAQEEILIELLQQSPTLAMLGVAVAYFKKREVQKEIDIKELNKELRELDRKNLEALLAVVNSLESNEEELKEIKGHILKLLQND